jgi:hypothetical protein
MRNGLTLVQKRIQTLVETLVNYGVVCKTAAGGELLLELYSLLECLEPEEHDLAERLSKLRFLPTRTADLGLYLVYISLPDVLAHLLPVSTLPEAQAWRGWLTTTGLPTQADLEHLCVGLPMTRSLDA